MLETKFKVAMWLTVLFMASLPIMGILRGTKLTPFEQDPPPQYKTKARLQSSRPPDPPMIDRSQRRWS